jgi:hypothetical protein
MKRTPEPVKKYIRKLITEGMSKHGRNNEGITYLYGMDKTIIVFNTGEVRINLLGVRWEFKRLNFETLELE